MNIKSYVILLSVFLYSSSFAQDTLTVGEVFDFEIGDVFQREYEDCFSSCWYYCPKTYVKTTIINKYYNAAHDSLFYITSNDEFRFCSSPPPNSSYSGFSNYTHTLFYFNLDSPVILSFEEEIDLTTYINDTVYFSYNFQDDFNGIQANTNDFTIGDLGSGKSVQYALGLGEVERFNCLEGANGCQRTKLIYYQKGSEIFGKEKQVVSINDIDISKTHTSPNPVENILEINDELDFQKVEIYNYQGQIVFSKLEENISNFIDMSDFAKGVYLLTFIDDKNQNIHTERIVK